MNIAELVLNLGVKGSDKTASALGSMQKGLKDTSSMALETKVAIAGAVYALEQLFAASGQRGTDLTNFNTLTGVSVQRLQQYQYAARQVGASNEEMETTFKSLQAQMTEVLTGGAPPQGIAHVADVLGINIDEADIEEFKKKPEKLLQILQQYAAKEQDIGLRRKTLASFNLPENIQTALIKGVFDEKTLQKAPTYTNSEVGALNQANIAWSNLRNKIEMSIGKFNAEHGNELVNGITKITDKVILLAEAFEKFADKIHLFEWFGKAIEGWTKILGLFADAVGTASDQIGKKGLAGATKDAAANVAASLHDWAFGDENEQRNAEAEMELKKRIQARTKQGLPPPAGYDAEGNRIAPKTTTYPTQAQTPPSPVGAKTAYSPAAPVAKVIPITAAKIAAPKVTNNVVSAPSTTEVNVNQNLNFQHDGKNSQAVASDVKRATNEAYRQLPQGQVK